MDRQGGRWLGVLLSCVLPNAALATDVVIYDEALQNGFSTDYSYDNNDPADTVVVGSTDVAHGGTHAIKFVGSSYGALAFTHATTYSTADEPILHFWIYGAAPGGQDLMLQVYADKDSGHAVAQASLNNFIAGGSIASGAWREVTVPLTQPPLSFTGTFNRIDLQSEAGGVTQPAVYLDDVALQSVIDPIFKNGFDGQVTPPTATPLVEEHDVSVLGMTSDRVTWIDSSNQPRVAVLAQNNHGAGPGGTQGGELRQFQYHAGGGTRTVKASGNGASGFGYVVSHPKDDGVNCTGHKIDSAYSDPYDTSLLGHTRGGSFVRVFEGRHHAIFRFTTTYPRYCGTSSPMSGYLVPVTIDWVFSTGRDDPLWSVTWDLSGVPQDKLYDDSRAPYGELLFDGSATEGAHSVIAGVGWGDEYKFASTSNPVTLQSGWTWNQANTIPYVKLWTTAIDATMGTVATRPIAQFDMAGGFGVVTNWNKTSANGAACPGDGYTMPCVDYWPYQSINFSLSGSSSTNNTRLAWGTEFGFLGQGTYHKHGSVYWGGPFPDTGAPGWPKKSYSVFVVLGTHSNDPVDAQVAQMEAIQNTSLSATVGTVAIDGPAGVNRDPVAVKQTYSPPGYDPVYGALTFYANANALDATIAVTNANNTLKNPLIVVRGYTAATAPSAVKFGGVTLTADADYFASVRADAQELWLTLNRSVSGTGNRLQITP